MSRNSLKRFGMMGILVAAVVAFALTPSAEGKGKAYGKPIHASSGKAVELPLLFSKTADYIEQNVVVEGRIAQVCPTSGCWITLTDGTNQLFVQFYDFTVRISSGTPVKVSGQLRMRNKAPYLAAQGLEVMN